MKRFTLFLPLLAAAFTLSSCATRPHTYAPPDSARLRASTVRVSQAVDKAHASARKAQSATKDAAGRAKVVREEVAKLKDVPPVVHEQIAGLETKLAETQTAQAELEKNLVEADKAKQQVEADKTAYFAAAQKLADQATAERDARIKTEKALSWYRWHFWLSWIVLGAGIVVCVLFAFLKATGRIAWAARPP